MERLGGKREATLHGFGKHGEDFFVYAWNVRLDDVLYERQRRGR